MVKRTVLYHWASGDFVVCDCGWFFVELVLGVGGLYVYVSGFEVKVKVGLGDGFMNLGEDSSGFGAAR